MLRVPNQRYRNKDNSLTEGMRLPPANFTRQMLSPMSDGAPLGQPTGSTPTNFPGRTDRFQRPDKSLMVGRPVLSASMDGDGIGMSSAVAFDTSTAEVLTTTADDGSAGFAIGPPVAVSSAPATQITGLSSVTSSSSSSIVNEGIVPASDLPSSIIASIPASTPSRSNESWMTPVSTSVTSTTSATTLSTTQTVSLDPESSSCDKTHSCEAIEQGERRSHKSVIIGTVIGVILAIIFVFTAWMFWRLKLKSATKKSRAEKESAWHKRFTFDGGAAANTDREVKDKYVSNNDGHHDLGEPGPAFYCGEIEPTSTKHSDTNHLLLDNQKLCVSTWSDNLIDPIHIATDSPHKPQAHRSDIGIALSRYTTAESTAPLSRPFPLANCPIVRPVLSELAAEDHKRSSSISAQSDATTRPDDEVVYVGKARTARRHSLTPRVINIAGSGGSSDKLSLDSKNNDSVIAARNNTGRGSFRSRSMSPNKLLSSYDDIINGISHYFQKDSSERPLSQNGQINRSSTTETIVTDMVRYPIIPTRGRSMKRRADQHVSYPPTSYPELGKTMSEVKKNIRERGVQAFASTSSEDVEDVARMKGSTPGQVVELSNSVTITRGGRGK